MARKKIIPKRIGKVKIPKNLRRLGDHVLSDPRSREVAGAALLALGSALASRGAPKGSFFRTIFDHPTEAARTAEKAGAEAASKAGEAVNGVAGAVSHLAGEVVEALRRELGKKRHADRGADPGEDKPGDDRDGEEDRVH